MSENVQVVCEGISDFLVIESAFPALLPGKSVVLTMIQPDTSTAFLTLGEHGGGWKGVRSWCQRALPYFGAVSPPKILILHVDADVADEPEVDCAKPCPPASDSTDALRDFVARNWCSGSTPDQMVFCTPSKNTEAWVLQALYPTDKEIREGIECRPKPESLLAGKPATERLVRYKDSKYKKDPRMYREKQSAISQQWNAVRKGCSEADRFSTELLEKIA